MANVTIKRSKHVQDVGSLMTIQQIAFTQTKRAEHVEKSVIWQVRVDLLEHRSTRQREATINSCWICGENGHLSSQCPKKKVHAVEDLPTASQVGSQDTTMVGAIGSCFGLGSVI